MTTNDRDKAKGKGREFPGLVYARISAACGLKENKTACGRCILIIGTGKRHGYKMGRAQKENTGG